MKSALLLIAGLVLGLGAAVTAAAGATQSHSENPAKLKKLRTEIAHLQAQEALDLKRKHRIEAQLSGLEKRIAKTSQALRKLETRIDMLDQRRKDLRIETSQAQGKAAVARKGLDAALRAAFILGREPELKLALNGNDPGKVARLLGYYGYYSKARAQHLMTLTHTLEQYQSLQQKLSETASELSQTKQQRQHSLDELRKTRRSRRAVIARLDHDIASKHDRAERLRRAAERLGKLVDSVSRDLADVPLGMLDEVDFAKLRGRLPWPVAGRLVSRYGSSRATGNLTWEAVRIAAPMGTAIHAIAYGRVAYAGWLPYYGLVLMIDHGAGYLTVYGHNETIYKQVGDWVKPGELVASVGSSGGQNKSMLYFQIRYRGRTLDPEHWCANGHPPRS